MLRTLPPMLIALPALLSGCLLHTEPCGIDFVFEEGRCVAAVDPPPYRTSDGGLDFGGEPVPDAGRRDAGRPDAGQGPDAGQVPDAGQGPDAGPGRGLDRVLIVDRTPLDQVRNTPQSPGADVDAIAVLEPSGNFWFASAVSLSQVGDPFGINGWSKPEGALGPRDAEGFNPENTLVCLGGEGNYVMVEFEMGRPFLSGDVIEIYELPGDPASDLYDVYLCPPPPLAATDCELLGRGSTSTQLQVP